jgi:hypothetical protein
VLVYGLFEWSKLIGPVVLLVISVKKIRDIVTVLLIRHFEQKLDALFK